jgi:hypothetical protein
LIGDARLNDQKFATRVGRRQNIAELYDIIAPWFQGKTRAEIQSAAQAKGVPFGPIFSPVELLETGQYVARGFLADMAHPRLGTLRLPQLPVQWNGRSFVPRPAPARPSLAGACSPGPLTAGANTWQCWRTSAPTFSRSNPALTRSVPRHRQVGRRCQLVARRSSAHQSQQRPGAELKDKEPARRARAGPAERRCGREFRRGVLSRVFAMPISRRSIPGSSLPRSRARAIPARSA